MEETIIFSFEMTVVQLFGAYLRYLPFSRELDEKKVSDLLNKILIWSVVGFTLNMFLTEGGINYRAYKISLAIGWLPYFLLSLMVIRSVLAQHIFVLGIQCLWCFMLHAFSGMIIALIYGKMTEELLTLQLMIYLLLFLLLLRVEQKFFIRIMPNRKFFKDKSLKWCISILPLAIFIGTVIPIMDVTFLPTWKEKFSRIVFPIFFLWVYRSMIVSSHQVSEMQSQEQRMLFLNSQIDSLRENNELMQKSQQEVSELRKNLAEHYRIIDELLNVGKISEAMAYIRRQAQFLDKTTVKSFCLAPLVNAALSIYLKRAEEVGITVNHKIDLPEEFETDENDLAVLLSNLLENAITASKKQDSSEREISIVIRKIGGQCLLEVSNRYDFPIKIGENGLPYTTKTGHGLGMSSLEAFVKKYNAYVDFSHENNLVQLSMYWNDKL